ncbi:hypothetical protein HW132_34975 [Brasilonema sp. CT11]|nr:hypothetical protein [Brasilonema sp. CT11]
MTLDTSDTSRKCPSFARFTLSFYTERELNEQEVNTIATGLAAALSISPERVRVLSIDYTPVSSKRADLLLAELEMEIAAANSTQQNEPNSAQAVQTLVETAKNTTALNQVLDPTGTQDLQFIGVKSAPTGVEQSGGAVPPTNEPSSSSKPPRSLVGSLASVSTVQAASNFVVWLVLFVSFW